MRMIDADALLEKLPVHPDGGLRSVRDECLMLRVRQTVENTPTIDLPDALRAAGWKEEGWISVKDRLPEMYGDYLTYTREGNVWPYFFSSGIFENTLGFSVDTVTHWMPLPEPPKEENE